MYTCNLLQSSWLVFLLPPYLLLEPFYFVSYYSLLGVYTQEILQKQLRCRHNSNADSVAANARFMSLKRGAVARLPEPARQHFYTTMKTFLERESFCSEIQI